MFLTPSGRFETNTKVCLSFSAYHPELWQPAWGIRLILEALISFLPTPADGAIGTFLILFVFVSTTLLPTSLSNVFRIYYIYIYYI